jgi:hypothetical protein
MKKILMTLAAVGLLFSCSKENAEPQLQPSTQDAAGIAAVDPNTPGAIRLSLDAEVAPFEVAQESYAEEQEGQAARGTRIDVGGPNVNSAITYRITPGADGMVPVLVFLHDNAGSVQVNGAKGTVTKDGKGLRVKLGALLDPKNASSNSVLKRIVDGKAQNPRLSILVGQDDDNQNFTNKGPQLITYEAGKTKTLPDNFILMKATGIPLKYDASTKELSVPEGTSISLTMQGYLIGARFNNTFPATMCRYGWKRPALDPEILDANGKGGYASPRYAEQVKRPPIDIVFRIENLSATYKAKIAFEGSTNQFNIGEDLLNAGYTDANIMNKRQLVPGLAPSNVVGTGGGYTNSGSDIEHGFREREHFLDATNIGEFSIPVRNGLDPKNFVEGEQFVVVYCPNPGDMGSIGFKSPKKLFYDDSPFSQTWEGKAVFNPLSNRKNSYRKRPGMRPENKFHFVIFPIRPTPLPMSNGSWLTINTDRGKSFKAYKAALDRLGYNHDQKHK